MSKKQLNHIADSNEWKERAIEILRQKTNAMLDVITSFVERFWQPTASDEENLSEFKQYESDYQNVYSY